MDSKNYGLATKNREKEMRLEDGEMTSGFMHKQHGPAADYTKR